MIPTSEIAYALVSVLLGLLVGYLVKNIIKIGLTILAIIIILIAIGVISPHTVISGIETVTSYTPQIEEYVSRILTYLPYNSLLFIIGFVIGLWKG
ncbi:MAG: hypothetical protein RXQ22_00500 [Sulfolobus sp.]|jgi:uncharacterized membrane protein (Fun14 family)